MTLLDDVRSAGDAGGPDPAPDGSRPWVDVCAYDDLVPDVGVGALVAGAAVAVFRCLPDHDLHAVGGVDPYTGASVLSRGIVGSIGGRLVVVSPLFKQRFDLTTGEALGDPASSVPVYEVRCRDGRVEVLAPRA